jgi:hypothetical protein
VTVRSGTQRYEASTWAPSPWPTIERLVADALDGANHETEPGRQARQAAHAANVAAPTRQDTADRFADLDTAHRLRG